jgi:protoporphyrinogen IX oxidase
MSLAYLLLKSVHMGAILIWIGALVLTCGLMSDQREPVSRLHRLARGLWFRVAAPSAAVAIGAGLLLAMFGDVVAWVGMKLVVVAGIVLLHVAAGAELARRATRGRERRAMIIGLGVLILFTLAIGISAGKPAWPAGGSAGDGEVKAMPAHLPSRRAVGEGP